MLITVVNVIVLLVSLLFNFSNRRVHFLKADICVLIYCVVCNPATTSCMLIIIRSSFN